MPSLFGNCRDLKSLCYCGIVYRIYVLTRDLKIPIVSGRCMLSLRCDKVGDIIDCHHPLPRISVKCITSQPQLNRPPLYFRASGMVIGVPLQSYG